MSTVSGDEGAVVAIAVNTATVPFLSTVAGETDLMPGSFLIASSRSVRRVSVAGDSASFFCWASCLGLRGGLLLDLLLRLGLAARPAAISCCSCAALCCWSCFCFCSTWLSCFWLGLAFDGSSTPISSGPLAPGPKPVGDQVVGLARGGVLGQLAAVRGAEVEVEHRDREHEQDADARDQRAPRARRHAARPAGPAVRLVVVGVGAAELHAQRVDALAERARAAPAAAWWPPSRRPARRPRRCSPSFPTNGMPEASSETSAITTVIPANTTAPPAVAVARAIDSRMSMPSRSWSLCRVTMKSA